MKKKISISLDESLLKQVRFVREKKFGGLASLSSVIEYYLRKGIEDDYRKLRREEELAKRGRLLE